MTISLKRLVCAFLFSFFALVNFSVICNAEEKYSIPQLTKEEMKADFDYLIKMVEDFYPKYHFNKEFYNTDMTEILSSYRDRIRGDESPGEYMALLNEAVTSCKGDHFETFNFKRFKKVLSGRLC